jgi:hypothetical protein
MSTCANSKRKFEPLSDWAMGKIERHNLLASSSGAPQNGA